MDNRELIDLDSAKERFMANEEMYKRFLFEFPERTLYAELKQCLEEENVKEAFEVAHRMKGVVENLSLNVFGKLTREVVEILREGKLPEQTVMDELDRAYEQSIRKIQDIKEKNLPVFSTSPEEQTPDFTGRRLLVAEDYDMNWEVCRSLLPRYGFTLEWAENGQTCVDMFNESEPGYYDAILMDLRMPVMNGYEAAKKIRSLERPDAALPIIAMTADDYPEDIQRCLECGMNTHITKPIDVKTLLSILQEHLSNCISIHVNESQSKQSSSNC